MTTWVEIDCDESDAMHRARLKPSAGLHNFHPLDPDASDPRLPPISRTIWCDENGVDVLKDERDIDGCRHWRAVHEQENER